ncbi:MAG: hypothetical protein LC660_01330 [Desulfobacteraceae bacterium]|nr:hypothetical protein [Desulfobacteraceae bacterium]
MTDAEYIGTHDLHKRFPFLASRALDATFNIRDGWLSTHEATYGFAKGATDARFFMKTSVTGIQTDSQGVSAVETDKASFPPGWW